MAKIEHTARLQALLALTSGEIQAPTLEEVEAFAKELLAQKRRLKEKEDEVIVEGIAV